MFELVVLGGQAVLFLFGRRTGMGLFGYGRRWSPFPKGDGDNALFRHSSYAAQAKRMCRLVIQDFRVDNHSLFPYHTHQLT